MDQLATLPHKANPDVLKSTVGIVAPLLVANSDAITSIPRTTHRYGSHSRQQLDLYIPTDNSSTSPILVFLYGGGLIRGDKTVPFFPGGIVYHNLGTFFARQGFTTIVADYRRVNDSTLGTGEDAVFPSGGEDIAAIIAWLESYLKGSSGAKRDLFIMGNSAGGVHLCTFLLDEQFRTQRLSIAGNAGLKFKGAVLLSVPLDFEESVGRDEVLQAYYPISLSTTPSGGKSSHNEFCGVGLLRRLATTSPAAPSTLGIPETLIVLGEFDPSDEIVNPNKRFIAAWKTVFAGQEPEVKWIDGHNHFSPPITLMSGDKKAESWGVEVADWLRKLSG
ncbi:Alpha/Beta hydrolase protein [Bisporella sp. PMI_857]|nr:Alpha/Beta hydrolase protein [Bisporella sp. PMI_857]